MPTRKDPKLVKSIHDVGPPRPSASSRPIITSSPAGDDPMVRKPEEAGAPPLSSHGRNIEPPKHDVPSSESSSGKPAGASPSDIIENAKSREAVVTSEPDPSKAELGPAPSPREESTGAPADEASSESSGDEPSARSSVASGDEKTIKQDDDAAKAAAESAEAERQAKYDEMVASGKYFLPINEAKQRYARKLLLALVIVLLILVAIDLLYDTGTLKSNSFNFHTHFFGS